MKTKGKLRWRNLRCGRHADLYHYYEDDECGYAHVIKQPDGWLACGWDGHRTYSTLRDAKRFVERSVRLGLRPRRRAR